MPKTIDFLAEQLKKLRKKEGLSQEEFAEKSGMSLTLIRDIERKKANPTLGTIDKIAEYFHISVAELLDADDVLNNTAHIKNIIHENVEHLSLDQLKIMLSLIRVASK